MAALGGYRSGDGGSSARRSGVLRPGVGTMGRRLGPPARGNVAHGSRDLDPGSGEELA
jgi:hypothetical protein